MIEHGHSWLDIKKYSLGEIGVFIRSINQLEIEEKQEKTRLAWAANHYKGKDLENLIKKMNPIKPKNKELSQKEIDRNWLKLAGVMKGMK